MKIIGGKIKISFKIFSDYCYSFGMLDSEMPNLKEQEKYHNRWMQKYATIFKNADSSIGIEWDLRCRKALKEMFSSAMLYTECKKNLEMCCFSSYYFCLYYSMFHAIKSVLFFDTNTTIDKLLDKTHSSTIDTFAGAFANSKKDVLNKEVKMLFEEFKFKRECYSYQTPFNNLFNYEEDLQKLEKVLVQCYQLGSFHSLMVEKSYKKHNGHIIKLTDSDERNRFIILFNKIFSKKDLNGCYVLEDSCENLKNELLRYGCLPIYIALDLEHELDEFHTYDSFYKNSCDHSLKITDIWSVLVKALNE